MAGILVSALVAALVAPAEAGVIKPAAWTASSSATPEGTATYDPVNVGDGKAGNAWFEGVDGSGLNEWIQADLGGEKSVAAVAVWGGWWFSKSQWGHYNRPRAVVLEFSDGSTHEATLEDSFNRQLITLPSPKKTSSVKLKIKSIYSSDAFNDTAISEIQIIDSGRDGKAPIRGATASSTYPADVDGSYDPTNAHDGLVDTVWCEGNKTGDGTGEWLELSFAAPMTVSSMALRNGNGSSFGLYMKSNRATGVTLAFADGSKETLTLKDTLSEQVVPFAARTTDRVRVQFTTVKKGTEFNDLCVAEVSFLP